MRRRRLDLTNIWPRQARIYGHHRIFFAVGRLFNCEAMSKINRICDLIASLEWNRMTMFDFRAYRDIMKIPGIARVWTTTETLAALSCGKREGAGLRLSTIGKTEDDLRK